MRLHSLPPPSSIGSGIRIFVILLLALLGPGVASASEDVVTIIVRFTEGEVSFPEGAYENTAPLEEVVFETEQLKIALANSGVYALSLVCPGWRHLEAPQYDIDGNEIDVAQMVDFTDVYRLEWNGTVPPEQIGFRLRGFSQVVYVDLMPLMDLHYDPPNDPLFSGQWGLHNTGQVYSDPDSFECVADYDINALEAWDIKDTSTVRVGLIDLGIDRDHEDLEDALDPYLWYPPESMGQEDCDTWPHGSATAGIVGAVGETIEVLRASLPQEVEDSSFP